MNIMSLRYFLIAAEELNVTKAAKRLYISQQALSKHISKLEAYYAVSLFDRGSPMTLTDAGKVLYASVKDIVGTLEDCSRKLQDIKDFTNGALSIGIPVTRGTMMLPPLCSAFHQMYPQIHLEIMEGNTTAEVQQALLNGEIDLMIGYTSLDNTNIVSIPLYEEKYVLLAPNQMLNDYFSKDMVEKMKRRPQPLGVFAKLPFVAQADKTMGGQVFWELCKEAGFEPLVVLITQNILTEINLCIAELGLCTVPNIFVMAQGGLYGGQNANGPHQVHRSNVTVFYLDSAIGSQALSINRLRSKTPTQAGRAFVSLAQSMFAQ